MEESKSRVAVVMIKSRKVEGDSHEAKGVHHSHAGILFDELGELGNLPQRRLRRASAGWHGRVGRLRHTFGDSIPTVVPGSA